MDWAVLGNALLIFVLRLTDVSLGTIRIIMTTRGHRVWAAAIGFVEVSIWVVAISRVIGHIDTVWSVVGYGAGFASGTLLGMWIENKLALGTMDIHIVSATKGPALAQRLREEGCGATQMQAEGRSGPVTLITVVAPRKRVPEVLRLINEVDPGAFITVEDTRQVVRGYVRLGK